MVEKYYMPSIPITNRELFEVAKTITVGELIKRDLTYNYIRNVESRTIILGRERAGIYASISDRKAGAPIHVGPIPGSINFLSDLLEIPLEEVVQAEAVGGTR